MSSCATAGLPSSAGTSCRDTTIEQAGSGIRGNGTRSFPISRWLWLPAADRLAAALVTTRIRPVHLTACGLAAAAGAAGVITAWPQAGPIAALLVLAHWFLDRADGLLARRQGTVSAWGAWFDANVDELADVALHAAVASVVAARAEAAWPWILLVAFLAGKYLLMTGLTTEAHATAAHGGSDDRNGPACPSPHSYSSLEMGATAGLPSSAFERSRENTAGQASSGTRKPRIRIIRRAYHLPGNADVRVHLLALALASGYLATELALVAVYYNFRWLVRYGLVARRLGGPR